MSVAWVFWERPSVRWKNSDGENTRRETQDSNGQADMVAEEQALKHIEAMLLKSSVKAGKAISHLNLQRAEDKAQAQEKREGQRVREKEQAARSLAEAEAKEKADGEEKRVKECQTARAWADAHTGAGEKGGRCK